MTDHIEVRGAREHNLKDVSLRIPKRRITVFTGVSGSGKSSLVFDTIATEAQRQLHEHFSLFIQGFLPRYPKPDTDAIENLGLAVIVDQKRLGGGPRSTVGTVTDIHPLLRQLFSRLGRPPAGPPAAFSFNDPQGRCPACDGLGRPPAALDAAPEADPPPRPGTCPLCKGARLTQAALRCRLDGYSIADLAAMEVRDLIPVLRLMDGPIESPMIATLLERLGHVADIGLGYLSLDRATDTLSGGESQRIKMLKLLGSSLVDVMIVLDEPSIGLHPHDVHRLTELLVKLRDKGNTVLVVEHDPDVIAVADHVVDIGPGAGTAGGEIVFEGSYADLRHSATLTGRYLDRVAPIKSSFRAPAGWMPIRDARVHNLRGVDVDIPTGVLTVITGVAGSGKSSLIKGAFLPEHPEAIVIDQSPIGTSSRSNPATYTGIMDGIRTAFGAANQVDAGLFSFNGKGACETCKGSGVIHADVTFRDEPTAPCQTCGGRRFKEEVLAWKLDGRDVSEVLRLTVSQALDAFTQRDIVRRLQAMRDVGLDYLTLGQPLSTLSGGEGQRLKLASELHRTGTLYVLDEPTTGLHPSDTSHLLAMLDRLVDAGNTVIVIEHNLDVVRAADWIVDLGPDGGSKGGRIVFRGTPAALLGSQESHTAEHLRRTEGTVAPPDADQDVLDLLSLLRGPD